MISRSGDIPGHWPRRARRSQAWVEATTPDAPLSGACDLLAPAQRRGGTVEHRGVGLETVSSADALDAPASEASGGRLLAGVLVFANEPDGGGPCPYPELGVDILEVLGHRCRGNP